MPCYGRLIAAADGGVLSMENRAVMRLLDTIYREVDGEKIPGTVLYAFIHNGPYHLAEIRVYKDGMIDCWGLETLDGFKRKVGEGWVVTSLP